MPVVQRSDTTSYVQRSATHDTIYLRDSVYVREVMKGDTVYLTRTQYRDRWRTDTIYQSKLDSIPYPVEVIKEVPAELTWWQQTRLYMANIMIGLLAIVVAFYAVRKRFC